MRDQRETIEYRLECDGWVGEDERCSATTPFFSDREYPHPADPEVGPEDMAEQWAKAHGWCYSRIYITAGDILDYCPECAAKRVREDKDVRHK